MLVLLLRLPHRLPSSTVCLNVGQEHDDEEWEYQVKSEESDRFVSFCWVVYVSYLGVVGVVVACLFEICVCVVPSTIESVSAELIRMRNDEWGRAEQSKAKQMLIPISLIAVVIQALPFRSSCPFSSQARLALCPSRKFLSSPEKIAERKTGGK